MYINTLYIYAVIISTSQNHTLADGISERKCCSYGRKVKEDKNEVEKCWSTLHWKFTIFYRLDRFKKKTMLKGKVYHHPKGTIMFLMVVVFQGLASFKMITHHHCTLLQKYTLDGASIREKHKWSIKRKQGKTNIEHG